MSQSDSPTDPPTANRSLSSADSRWIRARPDLQRELLPPSETWQSKDQPFDRQTLRQLRRHTIIEQVERVRVTRDDNSTDEVWSWRTTRAAWAHIQSLDEPAPETICPNGRYATGIENLGDDGYTCNHEDCDCRMDREQAMEVLNS